MRASTHNIQLHAAIVYWHVPPLALIIFVRKQLVHEVFGCVSSFSEDTLLAILAKHNIFGVKHARAANSNRFLTSANCIKADSTLPLRIKHDHIKNRYVEHVRIQLDYLVAGDVWLERRIDNLAMLIDYTVRGKSGICLWFLESELACECTLQRARKGDVIGVWSL